MWVLSNFLHFTTEKALHFKMCTCSDIWQKGNYTCPQFETKNQHGELTKIKTCELKHSSLVYVCVCALTLSLADSQICFLSLSLCVTHTRTRAHTHTQPCVRIFKYETFPITRIILRIITPH
jgi:hypothetical protein